MGVGRTWGGETRNEREKDKDREKHNIIDKGEKPLKNTDAQIQKLRGGSQHLESKMFQQQRGEGKQESRVGGACKGKGAKDLRTDPPLPVPTACDFQQVSSGGFSLCWTSFRHLC